MTTATKTAKTLRSYDFRDYHMHNGDRAAAKRTSKRIMRAAKRSDRNTIKREISRETCD